MKRVSNQKWVLVIGLLFFILLPYQAWAETWEYYTYGGYNAVVEAWRKVGLIFSDSRFVGLYFSVIALGMVILYFIVIARSTLAGSARFNLAGWAIPVLIGMAMYIALIVPKDRIVVYDTVLNKGPETIGNIPKVMATMAGLLNKIEKGMIDIVRTTTTPVEDYAQNAGGTGFIVLSQLGDQVAFLAGIPTHIWMTANKFIEDCVLFEIERPGTTLTTKQIGQGQKSFADIIQESKNPGVPTVYYDETGKEVDTTGRGSVTCYEAGEKLLTYLQEVNLEEVVKKACILSGFNIDNPAEWNQCRSLGESAYRDGLRGATGGRGNLNLLAAQKLLAEALINVLHTINPESGIKIMATKEAAGQYLGLVVHANTWLPVIKETLRATAIAISPFVLLFAATPLVGRALGFILGMMVWIVTWSVIDAILHYAAVSQALAASKEFSGVITSGTPGTLFFTLLPSYSAKVAATFGAIRWAGLGLATVLTGMLIRFGGAALAMVAGSITGAAQSAGAAMGRMVADVTSPIRADLVPTASWTNAAVAAGGVAPLASGLIAQQAGTMLGQAGAGRYLGVDKIARSTFLSTVESTYRNLQLNDPQTAAMVGTVAGQTTVGGAKGTIEQARRWGLTVEQLAVYGALGLKYVGDTFEGIYHRSVRTSDGRMKVTDVKTSLISWNLKRAESETREQLFSKIHEALKSKNFEQAWRFFKEYRHMLSKEHVEKLEKLGRHIFNTRAGDTSGTTDRETNKEEKTLTTGVGGTISVGGGDSAGGVTAGANVSAGIRYEKKEGSSKENTTENKSEDSAIQEFIYNLAAAITDSVKTSHNNTTGNLYDKLFKEQHAKQEAWKLTEQYKALTTLESSISINPLPLLVQHLGDKLLAEHPDKYTLHELNNAYDEAVRQLIEAIHSGDPQRIKRILDEIKTIQSIYTPSLGENIVGKGEELKQEVKKELQEKEEMIDQKGEETKKQVYQPFIPYKLPEAENLLNKIKMLSSLPPSFIETYIRKKEKFSSLPYFDFIDQPSNMGGSMATATLPTKMQLDPGAYNIPYKPAHQVVPNKGLINSPPQKGPYYSNENSPSILGPTFGDWPKNK